MMLKMGKILLFSVLLCTKIGEIIFLLVKLSLNSFYILLLYLRGVLSLFLSSIFNFFVSVFWFIFKRPKKRKKKLFSLNYYLLFYKVKYFIVGFTIAFFIFFIKTSFDFIDALPNPSLIENNRALLSTHILSRDGKLLYEVYREQNRTPVTLSKLPNEVKWATIAIEDHNFYKHSGVSVFGGILRAVKETVLNKKVQGGSTITQQLVKSALLTSERTISRKVKEIILALLVERKYNKDQILEMYLNQVPYGGTAWGIEEASQMYFGKSAVKLKLSEAALLAGLPQAPSAYSPYTNPKAAKNRQMVVLKNMFEEGYITKAEYEKATKTKLAFKKPKTNILAPHFVFYVKKLLEKEYGLKTVQEGGLRVYTTLDYSIQKEAEKILNEELDKLEGYNVGNGAILTTRPSTGEILAMVGSRDFFAGEYGAYNVTTALRQPGSSIKPINYAIGIDRGLVNPATVFLDTATCFNVAGQRPYCPKNYDGKFHGPVQLRFALANSFNIPAVKMLALNGVAEFIASASAFGITTFNDPSNYGLSLTLGGGEVKMVDMAKAFSAFPNQGVPKDLVSIIKVTDRHGEIIYQYNDPNYVKNIRKPLEFPNFLTIEGERVISKSTAFLISHILLDNAARTQAFGPSSALVLPKHKAVSVKTGTTDELKDNWTIGYAPNFLTIVWVGNNDSEKMNPYLVSGVTGAAPIWNKVMQFVLKDQPDLWPQKPEGVIGREVCIDTGKPVSTAEGEEKPCEVRFEYTQRGTNAFDIKVTKKKVFIDKETGKLAKPGQTENVEEQEKTIMEDSFSSHCVDCTPED
jgi:1A family penicillin-binding protein